MYLSKLEIIGFKSFAQKTSLGFDSGISAIVGPNGCGKTNIVDSIRWVLGEQRYSALRSEKMEDVIFNGTKSRKPLGMAEASLVIENTKGVLPSEYTQVTVGRRVYRSGESEYLLNKVPCRLKDIQDLFMDTGMGADAYSVIELKMVESILSDRTDERRHLFEEAAGVTKYKHRRKAAYRKLESVQADLIRVNDIVTEVQKAVAALERQAKKAEQHQGVKNRLKSLELDLMEREYAQLHSRRVPLEERLAGLRSERLAIDETLLQEESRLEKLRKAVGILEFRLAEAQRDASRQSEQVSRVEQRNLIAMERRKALDDTIVRIERERTSLKEEADSLEAHKTHMAVRLDEYRLEETEITGRLDDARARLARLEGALGVKRSELQNFSERTIALVHDIAERQSEEEKKRGRMENLHGRSARSDEEIRSYEEEVEKLELEIARFLDEDRKLRRRFTEEEMKYYDAEASRNELKERIDALMAGEIDLRAELERRTAKKEFLQGLIQSGEGLSEGVKFLSSVDQWSGRGIVTVADAAYAEERFRAAIEAAIGDFGGMIVVRSAADAEKAMVLLKKQNRGKATFVCLDAVPEISSIQTISPHPGLVGWASALVQCDPQYRALYRFILDRILVVQDREVGKAIVRNVAGVRCVTLDGEILTGMGIARGGSRRQEEGGGIGKQAQIEELDREINRLTGELSSQRQRHGELQQQHDAIDLKSCHEDVKRVEKEMSAIEVRMAQLQFEKKRAHDVILRNRQEIETLASEASVLQDEISASAPSLHLLREEKGEVERRVGGVQTELELLDRDWNEQTRMVNDLNVRIATINAEVHNTDNDLNRTGERIADIALRLEKLDNEVLRAREEIDITTTLFEQNVQTFQVLQRELQEIDQKRHDVEEELHTTREDTHQIEMKIRDERRQHDDSLQTMHDLELRIADFKAKAEHIVARALEEFETHLEVKAYPDNEFVDFALLRSEIQTLRDRIKSLGNINFAAFEEYTSEKQRMEFLTEQRKDLLEAEKTLISTIEEINTTAQRKFLETFGKIRSNFIETFKSLFDPGDECDLRLEEEVDPLEARIEIIAKPRGKRPTSIDLLSGGEKTLTATALLFAIYLVKPSPFCILDEVDAPLDDANIDRFTRILKKFSDNTQFIVVTHNKRTMEAANALYGVTMEEEGVSKLVTVRFNQERVKSAELVSG